MFLQVLYFTTTLLLTLCFFIYGFNHYYLLNASRKYKLPIVSLPKDNHPTVAIHLPIYNEKYVIRRLLNACATMAEHYDSDKVKIMVLDDSTDDTVDEVNKMASELSDRGVRIEVVHRENRQGFKAGALQNAIQNTTEEFIAIFDADFIPEVDFLNRTVPFFLRDKQLGIVQSRWCHLNRDFNLMTFAVALMIDIHFGVEQTGRYASGVFQNFNGSGGILRKSAILAAGGWQSDTLTEDLDLSYRMQLKGYKLLYIRDLDSPAEIPPTMPGYKQQQGRWANGSLRTAKKILPKIIQDEQLPFKNRVQAFIHLTGYFIHPLMTISFIVTCIGTFANLNNDLYNQVFLVLHGILTSKYLLAFYSFQKSTWLVLGPLIVLCTIAPWISSYIILRKYRYSFFHNMAGFFVLLLLGFGLSLSNTFEIAKGLFSKRTWEFVRTPKYAELKDKTGWQKKKYQTKFKAIWMVEFLFAATGLAATVFAIVHSNMGTLLVLIPFTLAYLFTFVQTVRQSLPARAK